MNRKHLRLVMLIPAVILLGLVPLLFIHRNGRVIPRNKMARIYAEMLITDQWINDNWAYNRSADTSFVYRPILRKYGYDEKDWRKSVAKYIKDPDRYSRILRKTSAMLEARGKELQLRVDLLNAAERREQLIESFMPERIFWLGGMRNPDNFVEDGLLFYVDSIGGSEWRFDPYRGYDTLFRGPAWEIVPRDSVTLDSLALDSLALDSLALDSPAPAADTISTEHVEPSRNLFREQPGERSREKMGNEIKSKLKLDAEIQ